MNYGDGACLDLDAFTDTDDDSSSCVMEAQLIQSVFPEATFHANHTTNVVGITIRITLASSQRGARGIATVHVVIVLPHDYPDTKPTIHFTTGVAGMRYHLFQIEKRVAAELTDDLCVGSVFAVLSSVTEYINSIPLSTCADKFVLCTKCNVRLMKDGLPKWPQPTQDPCTADCMTCHEAAAKDGSTVPLRFVRPNSTGEEQCSYCFCEETPLIDFPNCKCSCCVTCFQHLVDVVSGSRGLVAGRAEVFGLPCAIHGKKSVLADPAMFKLAPPRAYARYQYFSFELSALSLGAIVCPLPNCSNTPYFVNVVGSIMSCPYCLGYFCVGCKRVPLECRCDTLKEDRPTRELPTRPATQFRGVDNFSFVMPADDSPDAERHRAAMMSAASPILVRIGERQLVLRDACLATWTPQMLYVRVAQDMRLEHCEFVLFHCGMLLLSYQTKPLLELGFYPTTTVYGCLRISYVDDYKRLEEIDLWNFRRQMIDPEEAAVSKIGQHCPRCNVNVVHYRNHGCHHIGFAGQGCCGFHWCYCCRQEHPCGNCALFCNEKCNCLLCPECRPGLPCSACSGCPKCTVEENIMGFT
eukprot:PhM_4_TR15116/c0_g1_i1/m.53035